MNALDILDIFLRSSWAIRGVMLVLAAMSLGSWAVIFLKVIQFSRAAKHLDSHTRLVERGPDLESALQKTASDTASPACALAATALSWSNNQDLEGGAALRRALATDNTEQIQRLSGALPFLSTCAAAGPLLGLFGTVWGIMDSFHGFKGLQRQGLDAVATGLAEALSTTAMGLVVAIPAVLAYNYLVRRLNRLEGGLARFQAALDNRSGEIGPTRNESPATRRSK